MKQLYHYIVDWTFKQNNVIIFHTACGESQGRIGYEFVGSARIYKFIYPDRRMASIDTYTLCEKCMQSEIYKENMITFEIGYDGNPDLEDEAVKERYLSLKAKANE